MKKVKPKPVFEVGDQVALVGRFAFRGEESDNWEEAIKSTPLKGFGVVDSVEYRTTGPNSGWEYRVDYGPRIDGNTLFLWTDVDRLMSPLQDGEVDEAIASILRGPS